MAFNIWGSVLPWWRRGVAADMYIYIHTYILYVHVNTYRCKSIYVQINVHCFQYLGVCVSWWKSGVTVETYIYTLPHIEVPR